MVKTIEMAVFYSLLLPYSCVSSVASDQSSVAKIRLNSKINAFAKALFVKLLAF